MKQESDLREQRGCDCNARAASYSLCSAGRNFNRVWGTPPCNRRRYKVRWREWIARARYVQIISGDNLQRIASASVALYVSAACLRTAMNGGRLRQSTHAGSHSAIRALLRAPAARDRFEFVVAQFDSVGRRTLLRGQLLVGARD